MLPSSADIKRDIIASASKSNFIHRCAEAIVEGSTTEEQIQMGESLDSLTKQPGWTIVEQFMLSRMNLVGMAISDNVTDKQQGVAKGYIQLMQYISFLIKRKNDLKEQERQNYEAETLSKNEVDRRG